jgi:MFS family permease
MTSRRVIRTYLTLLLGNTLSASLIWGINTIFLLDAGLTNLEAFAANAFYMVGMVLFEIPTGVVADTIGRRVSYLLGTLTLGAATVLYVLLWWAHAPFWAWAVVSVLLGLGFTFFSGATEAWLVDALAATGYAGQLESVFGRGQVTMGIAMLTGSLGGGALAEWTNLGVPFLLRGAILLAMFGVAWRLMHDLGFSPRRGGRPLTEAARVLRDSLDHGWRLPAVRWLMVAAFFSAGVGFYVFYALQPHLLNLLGRPDAYRVAGLVAAIVAGSQVVGGLLATRARRVVRRRTTALIVLSVGGTATLAVIGFVDSFAVALGLIVVWGLLEAAAAPIRRAYLNGLIPSQQRATVLSFDSLVGSAGGAWSQPVLGRSADVWGYGASFVVGAGLAALALPFLVLSRRQRAAADESGAASA